MEVSIGLPLKGQRLTISLKWLRLCCVTCIESMLSAIQVYLPFSNLVAFWAQFEIKIGHLNVFRVDIVQLEINLF